MFKRLLFCLFLSLGFIASGAAYSATMNAPEINAYQKRAEAIEEEVTNAIEDLVKLQSKARLDNRQTEYRDLENSLNALDKILLEITKANLELQSLDRELTLMLMACEGTRTGATMLWEEHHHVVWTMTYSSTFSLGRVIEKQNNPRVIGLGLKARDLIQEINNKTKFSKK